MYKSSILSMIVECVEESEERFISEWDYISTLQTLLLLIDKFSLHELLEDYHFSKQEYSKYFEKYTKEYDMGLHEKIMKEFEERGASDES